MQNDVQNKIFLITGATGSLGNAAVKNFLMRNDIKEIRVFSPDEKMQEDMRRHYQSDKLKFYLGDVRDISSLDNAMSGVDYVIHTAALKQIPSCEFFPMEAVKTNIIGTENVLTSALRSSVKKVICTSSDKAVYPINAMGISKAMMEKIITAKARATSPQKTIFCCARCSNAMAAQDSVIPLFVEQIKQGKNITVTDPRMTRFLISLDEAVSLMLCAFENGYQGDTFIKKSPSCNILDLAQALKELFNAKNEIEIIGARHGEKLYETLLTKSENLRCADMQDYYRVSMDSRALNYENYLTVGDKDSLLSEEYNSNTSHQLSIEQIKEKLLSLDFIREELSHFNKIGRHSKV